MTPIKSALCTVAVAVSLTTVTVGLGASVAAGDPPPPPAPAVGESAPAWAPPKPAEVWDGQPVVWTSGWGGRWGVWINGYFITLSSNPVTNGG